MGNLKRAFLILIGLQWGWKCKDCGSRIVNSNAGAPHEDFLVHDHVWAEAGMEPYGGFLCVGCIEKRLGRRLTPSDFYHLHNERKAEGFYDHGQWFDHKGRLVENPEEEFRLAWEKHQAGHSQRLKNRRLIRWVRDGGNRDFL